MDELCEDLMNNLESEMTQQEAPSGSAYLQEYDDVISSISRICSTVAQSQKRPDIKPVEESSVIQMCPRIWSLAVEHKTITVEEREHCFLETLLKGSFSLLAIKTPEIAIKISACNLQVFLQLF